jgi:hypothetical protein
MEIKTRAFPYPVLGPTLEDRDDFTAGHVRLVNATGSVAPERYSIRFRFEISHPFIAGLVDSGDASPAVVVECRQNFYRRRHSVSLGMNEMVIPADELRGIVQVTPLISAMRELTNYRPDSLNTDYDGVTIRVPKHGILAYGPNFEFIAEPKSDRLRKISSIMRVIQTEDAGTRMTVNIGGPRIHVEVSTNQFRFYQSVAASRQGSAILASMLVLPVLVDVFHRIKGSDQDGLEDFRWFQVVRARLREIGLPVDAPDFDPMKAAQALLDSPFARGITELVERLDLEGEN